VRPATLTPEQIDIVKSTAPVLKQHGKTITSVFYRNMLQAHPELNNIFSLTNQQTGAQPAALAHAVLAYATHIEDLGKLTDTVVHIANKHASLFVQPEHYAIVGKYLIAAFGEVLGSEVITPDIKEAWVIAYDQLARIFIQVEQSLYREKKQWQQWRNFTIVKKEAESDSVTSFYLEPTDGQSLPTFLPGQYVSVQVPLPQIEGLFQSRQFSLSQAPSHTQYRVSVKREHTVAGAAPEDIKLGKIPGVVSNLLHDRYNVGDEVQMSAPQGAFHLDERHAGADDVPIVLLSAGVGATPNMAILQVLLQHTRSRQPITWAHAVRNPRSACFAKYVRDAAMAHPRLQARVFVKQLGDSVDGDQEAREYDGCVGPLDLPALNEQRLLHLDEAGAQYYICGPRGWMLQVRDWLAGQGVSQDRLHLEIFQTGGL
jgi:nitric oxide dioxygenase